MDDMLKGNYKIKNSDKPKLGTKETKSVPSLETLFEASAMEQLGGSMAFIKKSASFIWKGDKDK